MAARKGKDTQNGQHASLIPVIERHEQQLRTELEQARRQTDNQISQAEKQAQQRINEGRLDVSELVEQKREEELKELLKKAKQLSHSSTKHSVHLQQQVKNNMAKAVQRVVDAVTGAGEQT